MIREYTFIESIIYGAPYFIGTLLFAACVIGLINLVGKLLDALHRDQ